LIQVLKKKLPFGLYLNKNSSIFVLSGLVTISNINAGIQDDMNLCFKKSN
jgi:hypothetical protein